MSPSPAFQSPLVLTSTFSPTLPSPTPRPRPRHTTPRAAANPQPDPQPDPPRDSPLSSVRDFLTSVRRVAGLSAPADPIFSADGAFADTSLAGDGSPAPADNAPEVLVAGATGQTGRIVVRKLLLRGYKVRVLVRDLFSPTLDLLGTGVSYVKADLADYDALLDCVGDVDKVVCAVGASGDQSAEEVDYRGVASLISAFQDSRVVNFGSGEATKRRLFDFGKEDDFGRWRVVPPQMDALNRPTSRVNFQEMGNGRKAFLGQVYEVYEGACEMRTVPARIGLTGFSGIIMRVIGDGKKYSYILRTAEGVRENVEYAAVFTTKKGRWETVRLPFQQFKRRDMSDWQPRKGAVKLKRGDVRQMAIEYRKPDESPEKDDGKFYLAIDYIKTYRTQEEPDFVLVSCASVTARNAAELDEAGLRNLAADDTSAWKYMAESRLRKSGLTYTIVRPGAFTDQPGGKKALMLEQEGAVTGVISRADLAEICVKALLDPRACNVTFDAFESMYAPTAVSPTQDMSSLLGRLTPNT